MSTALTFWFAGWLFHAGFCYDRTDSLGQFTLAIIGILFWPLMVGVELRNRLK